MSRAGEVLAFLRGSADYVSGPSIASRMGITRTAVWKYLRQLELMGYTFQSLKGRGYRIGRTPDSLHPWEIERRLHTAFIGRNIIYREVMDSTNAVAFKLALEGCEEGTCVIAESQSAGRGRLNRKWHSPFGKNIYLSVVLRPDVHPSLVYPLTFISSLAAFDTLRDAGVGPRLKWPNDVLVGSRKICGTLIELSTEADNVRFVVIGIGLNVNMDEADLNGEIATIATSLFLETRNHFERARICGMLLDGLEKYYDVVKRQGAEEICRLWEERSEIRGAYLEITQMDRVYKGISEGIDKDGAILLRQDGTVVRVIAGDVTA